MTEKLAEIIMAFAENDMCIRDTAKQLYMDDGTVQYYLRKIREKTGRNPKSFYGLCYLVGIAAQMGGSK